MLANAEEESQHYACLCLKLIAGSHLSRRPGTRKLLAHKMASETEKVSEEKVSQIEETTELKKHRGIPEALFLVSIYR